MSEQEKMFSMCSSLTELTTGTHKGCLKTNKRGAGNVLGRPEWPPGTGREVLNLSKLRETSTNSQAGGSATEWPKVGVVCFCPGF